MTWLYLGKPIKFGEDAPKGEGKTINPHYRQYLDGELPVESVYTLEQLQELRKMGYTYVSEQ